MSSTVADLYDDDLDAFESDRFIPAHAGNR